uniref:CSON011820 protein n=1 Tax=Culicoides sonorensis TaxID=179676 RepID=A0A336K1S9_CULSO
MHHSDALTVKPQSVQVQQEKCCNDISQRIPFKVQADMKSLIASKPNTEEWRKTIRMTWPLRKISQKVHCPVQDVDQCQNHRLGMSLIEDMSHQRCQWERKEKSMSTLSQKPLKSVGFSVQNSNQSNNNNNRAHTTAALQKIKQERHLDMKKQTMNIIEKKLKKEDSVQKNHHFHHQQSPDWNHQVDTNLNQDTHQRQTDKLNNSNNKCHNTKLSRSTMANHNKNQSKISDINSKMKDSNSLINKTNMTHNDMSTSSSNNNSNSNKCNSSHNNSTVRDIKRCNSQPDIKTFQICRSSINQYKSQDTMLHKSNSTDLTMVQNLNNNNSTLSNNTENLTIKSNPNLNNLRYSTLPNMNSSSSTSCLLKTSYSNSNNHNSINPKIQLDHTPNRTCLECRQLLFRANIRNSLIHQDTLNRDKAEMLRALCTKHQQEACETVQRLINDHAKVQLISKGNNHPPVVVPHPQLNNQNQQLQHHNQSKNHPHLQHKLQQKSYHQLPKSVRPFERKCHRQAQPQPQDALAHQPYVRLQQELGQPRVHVEAIDSSIDQDVIMTISSPSLFSSNSTDEFTNNNDSSFSSTDSSSESTITITRK